MRQQYVTSIDKEAVLEVIRDNSNSDFITTKACILDYLDIEDNKQNRKVLTSVIKLLKEEGKIYTTYGLNDDEFGYRGRGYIIL